jgi:hypothetical protein
MISLGFQNDQIIDLQMVNTLPKDLSDGKTVRKNSTPIKSYQGDTYG